MGPYGGIIMMVVLFAVMYFMIIRPQKKREKLMKEMLSQLTKGDVILTIGGIIGKIVSVKDDELLIESGRGNEKSHLRMKKSAISEVLKAAPDPDDNYDEGNPIPQVEEKAQETNTEAEDK